MSLVSDKYNLLGGSSSFLGAAIEPERNTPNGLGAYQYFERGAIYAKFSLGNAFEVHGAILGKWGSLGWENSVLGFPISDESPTPEIQAPYRISWFEGGAIVWTPDNGARVIIGAIFNRWSYLGAIDGLGSPGAELKRPGIPLTDELITPDGRGRYSHFANASIYWTAQTGANEVFGDIKDEWASKGWERSALGYPIAEPRRMFGSSTLYQDFEQGSIYSTSSPGNVFSAIRFPHIFAMTGGLSISWYDFGLLLPDNDVISVKFTGKLGLNTRMTLKSAPNINWWKAISLWSPVRGDLEEIWNQDNINSASIDIPHTELASSDVYLLFKKAKVGGVHTGMYWLNRADRMIGNDVVFEWLAD